MTTERLEHHVGRSTFRYAVTGGDDAARGVAALAVGEDGTAQVIFALARIKEGVATFGVAVPDLDLGTGNRCAIDIADLTG